MQRLARVPNIDVLKDDAVRKILNKKADELDKDNWIKVGNMTDVDEGKLGQFGYQKTNDKAILIPLLYIVEVHTFRNAYTTKQYAAAIIAVTISEKTKKLDVDNAIVQVKYDKSSTVGSDTFSSTLILNDTSVKKEDDSQDGNTAPKVVQFGGWITFEDMIAARNEELIAQGKFTREEIEKMLREDGYLHVINRDEQPRLTRDNKEN